MHRPRLLVVLGGLAAAWHCLAAPPSNDVAPSTADGAPLVYRSAFSDYRMYNETDVANWKQLNDEVRAAAASRFVPAGPGTPAGAAPRGLSTQAPAKTPMIAPMQHMDHGGPK